MHFGGAIIGLKQGKKVVRRAWMPRDENAKADSTLYYDKDRGEIILFNEYSEAKAKWNPTHDDLMADDWQEL